MFPISSLIAIILMIQVECKSRSSAKVEELISKVEVPQDLTIEKMVGLLLDCKAGNYNGTYGKFLSEDSKVMPEEVKLKDSDYPYPHVLQEKIRDLQKYYPWKVRVRELKDKVYGHLPNTVEGLNGTFVLAKPIQVIELSYDLNNTQKKPGVLVFCVDPMGISIPSAMLLIIYNLLEKCESKIPLVTNLNWYFLPLGNPHGFYYNTISIPNMRKDKQPRAFMKNRRLISGENGECFGVNIDRNFDYQWGNGAIGNGTKLPITSDEECDFQFYAGPSAFSENESVVLRDFFLEKKDEIKLYIQLQMRLGNKNHALIEYPWAYTRKAPPGEQRLVETARCAQKLIHYNTKLRFKIRQASRKHHASGTIMDWLLGVLGAKRVYSIKSSVDYTLPINNKTLTEVTQTEFKEFKGSLYALAAQLTFPMLAPKWLCIPKWANIRNPKIDVKSIARVVKIKGLDLRSDDQRGKELVKKAEEIVSIAHEMERDLQGVSEQIFEGIEKLHIQLKDFIE